MTIPNTARKAGPLLGTGSQTAWPFTFKVFAAGDVQVTIANSSGTETLLVLGTDYTVTLNANQETSPGGTVNYPISGSALPVGSVLAIIGDLDYDQPLDLPSGGNFSPTALENQLDRSTMQIQQLREEMNRTAKLPPTSSESVEALVDDLQRIADSADNLDTVADNIADIITVADDLNEPVSEINTVAGAIANVNTVGNNIANVNTVAGIAANVTTVAGIQANVTTVAGIAADVTAVAGNAADISAVADNEVNIDAVAANATNINAVAANETNIDTVAGISADVAAVAAIDADVSTVADNLADVTNFADVYQGPKASDPTLRNDGSALQAGDLYFNTTDDALRAYSGTQWVAGTAGTVNVQTFSGNGSTTAFALASAPAGENNTQVFISGVYQQKDQYGVSGTTLTFSSAPPSGTDNIEVVTIATLALGETDASLVSFLQAGAGAVARTAQNKLIEKLSVLDFGAVPGQDCTAAIQAAGNAAIAQRKKLHMPGSPSEYLCGSVTFDGQVEIEGDGINLTVIRPTQDAGQVCWTITANGSESKIKGITFSRENGITNIGTALETFCYGLQMEDVEFVHNEYGHHVADGNFYHRYKNVYHRNNSSFLADDVGDNNDNIFVGCYYANKFTMYGGNGTCFYNCDFSSNPTIGNKPFVFIDPIAVNFFGCYAEILDTAATGAFDLFEFREDSVTGVGRNVQIHGTRAKGVSGKYETLFVFDDVVGAVYGGYVNGYTQIAETVGSGEVAMYSVSKQSGVLHFPATSKGSVFDHSTVRLDTSVSTPIASADPGIALNNRGSEANGSDLGTTTPIHKTSKAANSGTTRHYELYSGTTLAGSIVIDGNNEIRLVAHAASGRACLVEAGGQRLDLLSGAISPSVDNAMTCGRNGARWSVVWAGTGTISTSDAREKQQVRTLSEAERAVALRCKSLVRAFKFNDAVVAKGDGARIHVGVMAQEVAAAFAAEGLNAEDYALFCYDEWDQDKDIPAGNRYGIRYEQLLAFIIAAM